MLVPLTKSLYSPGKLGATDSVLVDVGTGYFIEYSPSGGVDYCKRKLLMLRENLDKLGEVQGWRPHPTRGDTLNLCSHTRSPVSLPFSDHGCEAEAADAGAGGAEPQSAAAAKGNIASCAIACKLGAEAPHRGVKGVPRCPGVCAPSPPSAAGG